MRDLAGKFAVIVGGSSGIGAASARMLAEAGATVAVSYHSGRERAEELIAGLPGAQSGDRGHFSFMLGLDDPASIRAAAAEITARHPVVDVLVNSAGFTRPVPHADLEGLDDALMEALLASNIAGPFATIRALAPALKASGAGTIVNISSVSAFNGKGSSIGYCASKAALDTMTISLARALGPEIRVLCVSPGPVATGFLPGRGREQLEKMAAETPLGRVVEPEDVARAVLACVTHLTASTGIRIVVDGGSSLV